MVVEPYNSGIRTFKIGCNLAVLRVSLPDDRQRRGARYVRTPVGYVSCGLISGVNLCGYCPSLNLFARLSISVWTQWLLLLAGIQGDVENTALEDTGILSNSEHRTH